MDNEGGTRASDTHLLSIGHRCLTAPVGTCADTHNAGAIAITDHHRSGSAPFPARPRT